MTGDKSTYQLALEDHRWITRRRQIINRADGRCEECGLYVQSEAQLQVHHRHYRPGAKPWQYEDDDLIAVCRDCHEEWTDWLERVSRAMGRLPIAALPELLRHIERMRVAKWPHRLPLAVEDDAA